MPSVSSTSDFSRPGLAPVQPLRASRFSALAGTLVLASASAISRFALALSVFVVTLLSLVGCGNTIPLRADSRWYVVESLQLEWSSRFYEVSSERSECRVRDDESGTIEVRLMRLAHFMDLSKISDDPSKMTEYYRTTEHAGVPLRLLDSGPLDLTLPGAARRLSVGPEMMLLVRSSIPHARLSIRELEPQSTTENPHGN